jgi:transcriptional regulator with XRE-family HTH domain
MKCSHCKVEMSKRRTTSDHPYLYKRSGLSDVALEGIDVYVCPNCCHEVPIIPKVGQLHATLAAGIIRQSRLLKGEEIRFLRKHAGLPAQEFALLIGVTPQHLSRIENGHTDNLGKPTDRLVRALTLTAKDGRAARTTLLTIAGALEKNKARGTRRRRRGFTSYALRGHGWRRSA